VTGLEQSCSRLVKRSTGIPDDRGDFAILREVGDQALERIIERERGLEIDPIMLELERISASDLDLDFGLE
jgi:hypothetical protein